MNILPEKILDGGHANDNDNIENGAQNNNGRGNFASFIGTASICLFGGCCSRQPISFKGIAAVIHQLVPDKNCWDWDKNEQMIWLLQNEISFRKQRNIKFDILVILVICVNIR